MRVALVGRTGTTGAPGRTEESGGPTGTGRAQRPAPIAAVLPPPAADPGAVTPARPPPPRSTAHAARPAQTPSSGRNASGDAASAGAEALVTAVQSDVWVLSGSAPPARGTARPAPAAAGNVPVGASASAVSPGAGPPGAVGASAAGAAPSAGGAADGSGKEASGAGGEGNASLLGALSQRLAWSAARCAPAEVVRTTRHAIPGVPLHFCLDAAGRPSDVGLLGTTGSELLDRAARDCVVPGALPLPPVPGCYTVEVRFPTRG